MKTARSRDSQTTSTPLVSIAMSRIQTVAIAALGLLTACRVPDTRPAPSGFNPTPLVELTEEINEAIAEGRCPGGVLHIEHRGNIHQRAFGNRSVTPAIERMTPDTIFDLASLTKVVATAPAILLLAERGQLQLDDPVANHLPEFARNGKERVTLRHLLTHTSGLRPGLGRRGDWQGPAQAIALACEEQLRQPAGSKFVYSDINFILLGEIVHRVSGKPLDRFATEEVFQPLGMRDTTFNPGQRLMPRVAPTEKLGDGTILRGVVHDPTSRRMGGVAGHAGLFSTASDLARYARMLLNGGAPIFQPESIRLMTTPQSPVELKEKRGLGWDIDTAYSSPRGQLFPGGSFGHTGWTGTSIWIDPSSESFVIFLSNRNHPSEKASVVQLRKRIGTLAARAIPNVFNSLATGGFEPRFPVTEKLPSNLVLNGIDMLKRQNFAPFHDLKIGLITNHTGRDRKGNSTIDLLHRSPDVNLLALFSPEHGIRGEKDENVGDGRDAKTDLPIYSLYGQRRKPSAEQLAGLDALVFDIQDIGCRFYTYIATMGNCMEAAAESGLKFVVLDRVNPINGRSVQGPIRLGEPAFVACHDLPLRHGMTVGELARMFNEERGWNCDLELIRLRGWQREMWFEDTELPWRNPSPNMRDMTAAAVYPGVGLVEFSVSVGRGTEEPFHLVGAPYADADRLAEHLNHANLPGVRFAPTKFTPASSVFAGQLCEGVRLHVTDRDSLNSPDLGITLALVFQRLYPDKFALEKVDKLLRHPPTIEAIRAGKTLAEIRALWSADQHRFRQRRKPFLLYRE